MAFTTYIFKEDIARLQKDADLRDDRSFSLYGQWTSTGNPVVHVAISKNGFYDQGVGEFFYKNYRLCHIGEWRAAKNDYHTREELLSKSKGSRRAPARFVILEVNREAAFPFLFVEQKLHGEGRVEVLQGENPFNKAELLGEPSAEYRQGNLGERHSMGAVGREVPSRRPDYFLSSQSSESHLQPRQLVQHRQQQGQEAYTSSSQWYASKSGQEALKQVLQSMKEIALSEVEMTRDTRSHDMTMSFTDQHRKMWEVKFSFNFPQGGATVTSKSHVFHSPSSYWIHGEASVNKVVENIKRYFKHSR